MQATAAIAVEPGPSGARLTTLRSEPPLLLRPTADAVLLVGGAAGPLGGDRLRYEIEVAAGASLCIRSAAASMVLPGTVPSELTVSVTVGDGGFLDWSPEPSISVVGSRHVQRVDIDLCGGATLSWREGLVLGRTGEGPGAWSSSLRVRHRGDLLSHTQLDAGPDAPGWAGPASLGGAGAIASQLIVGPAARASTGTAGHMSDVATFALADDAVLHQALGPTWAAADAGVRALAGH